jgi:hypothetical protein
MFSDKKEAGGVEDEQDSKKIMLRERERERDIGREVWLLKGRLMGTLAGGYKGGDLIKVQNREAA